MCPLPCEARKQKIICSKHYKAIDTENLLNCPVIATFAIPQACIINTKLEKKFGGGGTCPQYPGASSASGPLFMGQLHCIIVALHHS